MEIMVVGIVILINIAFFVSVVQFIKRLSANQQITAFKVAELNRKMDRVIELLEKAVADSSQPGKGGGKPS